MLNEQERRRHSRNDKARMVCIHDEEASHGDPVPPIDKIAMYCKPLEELPGEQI